MPYDSSLDQQLFSKFVDTQGGGRLIVSAHSYNGGPKKIQISREIMGKDESLIFAKLGRLAKEELEGVIPLLKEALDAIS